MPTPDGPFRLRCFRQTLSVSIFVLKFPWQAWTAAPPSVHSPPSFFQIEALGPIRRCAIDAAVIGIAIFGFVVWSHGTCGIQTRLRVSADYIWPELGRLSSTLLHIPYPDRGVVWHSIQSVFTRLFTCFLLTFPPPRICASVC